MGRVALPPGPGLQCAVQVPVIYFLLTHRAHTGLVRQLQQISDVASPLICQVLSLGCRKQLHSLQSFVKHLPWMSSSSSRGCRRHDGGHTLPKGCVRQPAPRTLIPDKAAAIQHMRVTRHMQQYNTRTSQDTCNNPPHQPYPTTYTSQHLTKPKANL